MQPGDPGDLGAFGLQVPQPQQQLSAEAVQGLQQLQAALVQAHQMQHRLQEAQQQIAATQVNGQAGGGLVEVTLNGSGEILGIRIDPQVVDPNDVETLQDLVVGALTNAAENMRETVKEILGPLAAAAEQQQQPGQQMPGF
jgi:DNA-binding YbaB/EbfC family protein